MKFIYLKESQIEIINRNFSKYVIYLVMLFWLVGLFKAHPWTRQKVVNHDIVSYYSYLPATFIYKDLTFEFTKDLPKDFKGRIWYLRAPNGAKVQKMSMGMAVLYSPFFLMGHVTALVTKYNADGYTSPYELFLCFGSLIYSIIALFLLRKILKKYFNEMVVGLTILAITLGTNHYYYVHYEGAMSHAFSFFLFVIFLHLTIKWHERVTLKTSLFLGLAGGLITLVRPTNIIVFVLPVLYGIYNKESLINKIEIVKKNLHHLIIIGIVVFLVFLPQMIYWKSITGHWLYYSYSDEGFFFNQPNIIKGLLSYRKGWLIYAPVMFFAIAGIVLLYKRLKDFALPISVFIILNVYLIFSWWCWWYGGGYGSRPMIESYVFLSIPLAVIIKWIFDKKFIIRSALIGIIIALICLNQFQTWQYKKTLIHWDSMTKEAYWAVFGRRNFPPDYQELIQEPDYANAKKGKQEYSD